MKKKQIFFFTLHQRSFLNIYLLIFISKKLGDLICIVNILVVAKKKNQKMIFTKFFFVYKLTCYNGPNGFYLGSALLTWT